MKSFLIRRNFFFTFFIIYFIFCSSTPDKSPGNSIISWPVMEKTMKPWTRWWWMGNAVNKEDITKRLEEFAAAGIGGVEITPIYGVKGYENRFLEYLSPEWMEMLIHTLNEAGRLGLGVDMILGTGWPFGGPQVEKEHAAGKIYLQSYSVKAKKAFRKHIVAGEGDQKKKAGLQYIFAFDSEGHKTDLLSKVKDNHLDWIPDKDYTIYAIFNGKTGQKVKRAAPGGEGLVLDHFSAEALNDYLEPYNQVMGPAKNKLRAVFNDSYEVYDADYTPLFFQEFQKRRGYDFTDHLPLIQTSNTNEDALLILGDYRATLADLVLESMSENWAKWAGINGFRTKYQAHGCPGNLLDIYASADIPECESFYATAFDIPGLRWEASDARQAYPDLIMLKFASSAANISGKALTSSETFTWLREHFKTALSQCKPELEQIFLSGVNHVFFHGSTYSPDEAGWPGWKFYASVNFSPTYAIWKDAPYMFEYIQRCQSLLQSGTSDNEILVYWPFYDVIEADLNGQLLLQLGINNKDEWLVPSPFHKLAGDLMDGGYSVDFVSDKYLERTVIEDGEIKTPGRNYKALVIPDSKFMPAETMETLIRLVESGGKILFEGLPETVPGYYMHDQRTKELLDMIGTIKNELTITTEISAKLSEMGISGEKLVDAGLKFVRRDVQDGKIYYLVNHTSVEIDQYIPIGVKTRSVIIMDPLSGNTGEAEINRGRSDTDVYVQLKPGQAVFLRSFDQNIRARDWDYVEKAGEPAELSGSWDIEFLTGGPDIPDKARVNELRSWTGLNKKAEAFSGTARYTIRFKNPDPEISRWQLDLGDVRESARIFLNGDNIACLWSVPFKMNIGPLKDGENILEIEVTNLSANRLRDLDLRGIEWKIFYDINMVNRNYEPFDARGWEPMPSGLLGKVSITPLEEKSF